MQINMTIVARTLMVMQEFLSPMEKMVSLLILGPANIGYLQGLHYSHYTGTVTVNIDGRKGKIF